MECGGCAALGTEWEGSADYRELSWVIEGPRGPSRAVGSTPECSEKPRKSRKKLEGRRGQTRGGALLRLCQAQYTPASDAVAGTRTWDAHWQLSGWQAAGIAQRAFPWGGGRTPARAMDAMVAWLLHSGEVPPEVVGTEPDLKAPSLALPPSFLRDPHLSASQNAGAIYLARGFPQAQDLTDLGTISNHQLSPTSQAKQQPKATKQADQVMKKNRYWRPTPNLAEASSTITTKPSSHQVISHHRPSLPVVITH
ncbi:hypothetical protein EDB81DRAFT_759829 [Dactylonectria macrodidyma]|uniref:Uncharacterized protein n=1 Tax=Dactylonectria macrodidyma TaxID=307937 RepID=A0A9P9J4A8_9HYPO|nr:hypothetical protein EDB81DRAFT_759829 [Dactylonectria macrodidyma]